MRLALQERPCTRCVKRDIGHLCHDEPREAARRSKGERGHTGGDDDTPPKQEEPSSDRSIGALGQQQPDQKLLQEHRLEMAAPVTPGQRKDSIQLPHPVPASNSAINATSGSQLCKRGMTSFDVTVY